ncbi:MAG: hypothetical protein U9N43_06560 [Euryarchaeota archaeon]|nr:hypothetical protein [Euryarchaeota archaeon]
MNTDSPDFTYNLLKRFIESYVTSDDVTAPKFHRIPGMSGSGA